MRAGSVTAWMAARQVFENSKSNGRVGMVGIQGLRHGLRKRRGQAWEWRGCIEDDLNIVRQVDDHTWDDTRPLPLQAACPTKHESGFSIDC